MRKLKQIIKLEDAYGVYMETPGSGAEILALDDNGELWHGTIESTDDDRRVIDWTPVNTPKDGAAYSEPQLSRFDKWEAEANEQIKIDTEAKRKALSLATKDETDTG